MEPIKIVIGISISSIIVGIINTIISLRIASKQNKIELKKTKLDILENRRNTIEAIRNEIGNRMVDVGKGQLNAEEHFPIFVKNFQLQGRSALKISHFLDQEVVSEIKQALHEIDSKIMEGKQGVPSTLESVNETGSQITTVSGKINDEIERALIKIEAEVQELIR